jgi:hypothetical protein
MTSGSELARYSVMRATERPGLVVRVARWCVEHRRRALIGWVAALPGTESQRALDVLQRDFPAQSGDVITAAATIMICVFLAFVLGPERQIKLFGLGLVSAVFPTGDIRRL